MVLFFLDLRITTKVNKPSPQDGGDPLEKLKTKQNEEMLVLLEEEREKEKQREAEIEFVTDPERRKHLEKTFKIERGLACARIEQLAEYVLE